MGRPNELDGQVRPNTLSTPGGRPASLPPVAAAPGWKSPAQTFPTAKGTPRPATARPARLWSFIVFAVIAFNVIRAVTNGLGSGSGGFEPTTAPALPTRAAPIPGAVMTADVAPGTVAFGTRLDPDCDVLGAASAFAAGTPVWWYAHLSTPQSGNRAILTILKRDGVEVESSATSSTAPGQWESLCAIAGSHTSSAGVYRLEVWNDLETVLLASGQYVITASPSAVPS